MIKTILFLTALGLIQAAEIGRVKLQNAVVVEEEDSCEYLDNGCPADYSIHLMLPHETSCRRFYICANGELIPSKCAPGTVFNPAIQGCDHAGSIDRLCEEEDSSSEEVVPEESQSSEEIELLPNGCPVDFNIPQYLPHGHYCNKYYQCNFGQLIERYCAYGTHWNPSAHICDFIANVGCTLPGGDAIIEVITPGPVTTPTPPTDLLDNGCPADGSINWLVPHADDCGKFNFCIWGTLVPSNCPAGLHFSVAHQACESPAVAGCMCQSKECSGDTDDDDNQTEECTGSDCGNDDAPGCTGNDCDSDDAPSCTGNDCDSDDALGCTGSDCDSDDAPVCTGTDCESDDAPGCSGNDCDSDDAPGCTGNDCDSDDAPGCTGNDCESEDAPGCTGNDCDSDDAPGCIGNDCESDDASGCTGNDCESDDAPGCTGNDCESNDAPGCTGNDCESDDATGCTGNNCDNDDAPECTGSGCDDSSSEEDLPVGDAPGCTGNACDSSSNEEDTPVGDDAGASAPECPESDEAIATIKCEEECNVLPWSHGDCDKYWKCVGKEAVLVVCSEGLHFNPSTHTCDFACNVGCVRENIQTTSDSNGIRVYLPWSQVNGKTSELLKLIAQ